MTPALHPVYDREETPHKPACAPTSYLSMIWVMRLVIRCLIRARYALRRPLDVQAAPSMGFAQNRKLRRAKAACIRRLFRDQHRGRAFDPSRYMPRAYTFFPLFSVAPSDVTPGQFKAFYARESGLGRVRVYGLAALHDVTKFLCAMTGPLGMSTVTDADGVKPADSNGQTDPAPP